MPKATTSAEMIERAQRANQLERRTVRVSCEFANQLRAVAARLPQYLETGQTSPQIAAAIENYLSATAAAKPPADLSHLDAEAAELGAILQ
jgi:hypothetical protein